MTITDRIHEARYRAHAKGMAPTHLFLGLRERILLELYCQTLVTYVNTREPVDTYMDMEIVDLAQPGVRVGTLA